MGCMLPSMTLFCRPVAKDITVENVSDMDIFVELNFSSSHSGVKLEIEKDNPNLEYTKCTSIAF